MALSNNHSRKSGGINYDNVNTWSGHITICQDSKLTSSPSHAVKKPQLWSSTSSPSPCLRRVKQWIMNPPQAWSYCIPTPPWVCSPYFHFPPAGINQPITFCPLKFVMSVRRCSTFRNHSATDSINQYYHGNIGRAMPTPPHPPPLPGQWRGKAIMQVAHESRKKRKNTWISTWKREEERLFIPDFTNIFTMLVWTLAFSDWLYPLWGWLSLHIMEIALRLQLL